MKEIRVLKKKETSFTHITTLSLMCIYIYLYMYYKKRYIYRCMYIYYDIYVYAHALVCLLVYKCIPLKISAHIGAVKCLMSIFLKVCTLCVCICARTLSCMRIYIRRVRICITYIHIYKQTYITYLHTRRLHISI